MQYERIRSGADSVSTILAATFSPRYDKINKRQRKGWQVNVPWTERHCIVCPSEKRTEDNALTKEHIIPESIGGVLTCNFLCGPCNCIFGQHHAKTKESPEWRLAIEALRDQIPGFYRKYALQKQDFIAKSEGGSAEGRYHRLPDGDFDFRVKGAKLPDGSLVQPTDDARSSLLTMLRKAGLDDSDIHQALQRFDAAPENQRVTIAPGFDIVKWTVTRIGPKLDGRLFFVHLNEAGEEVPKGSGMVLLKIAYEYLALHLFGARENQPTPARQK